MSSQQLELQTLITVLLG